MVNKPRMISAMLAHELMSKMSDEDVAKIKARLGSQVKVNAESVRAAVHVVKKQKFSMGTLKRKAPKIGRNEPCPCNSGKKYKRCHGGGK